MDDLLRQQIYEIVADMRRAGRHIEAARIVMVIDQYDRRLADARNRRCNDILDRAAAARAVR